MNRLIQLKKETSLFIIALLLACFAVWLAPNAFGVIPAPDGGYPGGNSAEGQAALGSLTTGTYNTAVGFLSLRSNTEGMLNTAVGAGALLANIGADNTATGAGALLSNNAGVNNTANGVLALFNNTTGEGNTAIGSGALLTNVNGIGNTALGFHTLFSNTEGGGNTAVGYSALFYNTSGSANIAIGEASGENVTTANSVICIGDTMGGDNVSDTTWIANIFGTNTVSATTQPVIVSDTGQLGTISSSRRFKKDIQPMEKTSETILSLRPVTFHYKTDTKSAPQFGLIAEEVAKVNPALVLPDKEGKPYTVRYDAVNAMLLNEFLKEHRKVEKLEATIALLNSADAKQEATIARQQKQIEALTAGLQKVSTQLELSKPAVRVVNSNQ